MKITQKLFVLLFAGILAFAMSCEENVVEPDDVAAGGGSVLGDSTMTNDWQEVEASALPQAILDYINENYPDEEIEESWLTDEGEYLVVLDEDLILIFDSEGNFVEEYEYKEHRGDRDPIDVSELPQSVIDYLAANYPDAEIKKAFVNEDGEYIVKLDNRMVVIFDADGNFIEEFEKERRGRHDEWDEWDEIDVDELPQAILDYIAANYAGDTIVVAGTNEDGEYGVILSSVVGLLFDADGNFIESFDIDDFWDEDDDYDDWEEVDVDDLPQAIKDYVAENYPDETIDEAGLNQDGEYGVILSDDTILIFDADGNFLEAYDDDHDDYEDCDEVDVDDLPQAILDYLAANHPDDEIEGAWYDDEEEIYIIELDSDVNVIFDKDGNYIETEECDD